MLPVDTPTRACTATGCTGTMYLHDPLEEPPFPTHLEFPSYATWVCADNPAHVELLTFKAWAEHRRAYWPKKRTPRRGWFARWLNTLRRSTRREQEEQERRAEEQKDRSQELQAEAEMSESLRAALNRLKEAAKEK